MIRSLSYGIRKYYLSQSETILRSMPRFCEGDQFEQTYNKYLTSVKNNGNFDKNIVTFPIKSFKRFSKYTIKRLINSSFKIIKSNEKTNTIQSYNCLLLSYITHNIHFDISAVLKDMEINNIQFNNVTYALLIDLYSERGDMDSVKNVVNSMKDNTLAIPDKNKRMIYGGYIRTKQFDVAKQFIKDENLDENCRLLLIQKCKAYADIGYFKDLMETLQLIRNIDSNLPSKIACNLYKRLIKAVPADSELDEILSIADAYNQDNIVNLILNLNSDGLYSHSLKLMLKFHQTFVDETSTCDVIKSFCSCECPNNIYATVLETLTARIFPNAYLNLFANIHFDESLEMCIRILTTDNAQCILSNLLMKAVDDKSISKIYLTFQKMEERLLLRNLNSIVQYVLIPSMLDSKIISKPDEILKILPNTDDLILPSVFMYHLCKGDFSSFESLRNQNLAKYPLRYSISYRTSAKNILDNVPFKYIEKVANMTIKIFSPQLVNLLIGNIIRERIVQLSIHNDIEDEINETIQMAKKLGATYKSKDIEYLEIYAPKFQHLFTELKVIERTKNQIYTDKVDAERDLII